ncbi:CpaF family protein [Effusibacillus dendaii]|uniref:Secretory protein kinase n=1 Tax=Effusibacillus dendaii TaxID=2743772 RepID=A0A7I8DH04_9BACL|nr:ATPase, T2SS/T4P/T4SS family [Effusibacillus dendaii]BCJ88166.1 secretory protein kinase [Effusibacillus dendaii]
MSVTSEASLTGSPELEIALHAVIRYVNDTQVELVHKLYQKKIPISVFQEKLDELLLTEDLVIPVVSHSVLKKLVLDELLGYGILQPLVDDPSVTDIFVNHHQEILVRRNGADEPVPLRFRDAEQLEEYFRKIMMRLGARVDRFHPIVDTRDPDLHLRINGGIPPVVNEPYFTIRKHQADTFTLQKLIETGTLTRDMADTLQTYVGSWLNLLISGPTGSGKTTLLRALCECIDPLERLAVLEEEAELRIPHQNIVALETKKKWGEDELAIEMDLLVKNAMRMSPRRIVLGELRHKEALELIRAFGTGHDGGLTCIHANDVKSALKQLAFLMLYADTPLTYEHLLSMIADSVDIVVHIERYKVVEIAEVVGFDSSRQTIATRTVWRYQVDPLTEEGVYEKKGESDSLLQKMALRRSLRKRKQPIPIPARIIRFPSEPSDLHPNLPPPFESR